jgi:hypothetical protein
MEGKILKCALAGIVICIVIGAVVLYCFKEYESITLGCELPTEQPILPVLEVQEEGVSNETEARAIAVKYFPQFENATLVESGLAPFVFKIEHWLNNEHHTGLHLYNELLQVHYSGCLMYDVIKISNPHWGLVSPSEFPKEKAIEIAEAFISKHGSAPGTLQLRYIHPVGTLVGIEGYFIMYDWLYTNNIPITGGDGIKLHVKCDGNVTSFSRLFRTVVEEGDVIRMISASQAFDALTTAPMIGPATITEIDVCYYSAPFRETQEYMNPTWRFKMEGGNYLYVDGVTGEYL